MFLALTILVLIKSGINFKNLKKSKISNAFQNREFFNRAGADPSRSETANAIVQTEPLVEGNPAGINLTVEFNHDRQLDHAGNGETLVGVVRERGTRQEILHE